MFAVPNGTTDGVSVHKNKNRIFVRIRWEYGKSTYERGLKKAKKLN